MTVDIPDDAAYVVYDENDVCVDFSTVSHNTATVLPANGKVAFIGRAGDGFGVDTDMLADEHKKLMGRIDSDE